MTCTSTAIRYEVVREDTSSGISAEILEVFQATRTTRGDETRFDWLYNQNPDGRAVVWTIRRSDNRQVVGFTACLPRRVLVRGTVRRAWIGSDFSILPRFRTLGLAARLRRAAKEAIDSGEVDLLYAHPNDRMAVIHKRVGHFPVGMMQRYARLLRSSPVLEEYVRSPLAADLGAMVIDPFLAIAGRDWRWRRRHRICRENVTGFDERFDELFDAAAKSSQVVGVRDARYLNWRYRQNPLMESRIITAHADGKLVGFLVYTVDEDSILIHDVFPMQPNVVQDLLADVTTLGRELGLRSVSLTILNNPEPGALLRSSGFRPRAERSQMYVYASGARFPCEELKSPEHWNITAGDRDV